MDFDPTDPRVGIRALVLTAGKTTAGMVLPLDQNLTVLYGLNGSGKSLILECLDAYSGESGHSFRCIPAT